jgi:hypothetical protein
MDATLYINKFIKMYKDKIPGLEEIPLWIRSHMMIQSIKMV